MTLLRIVALLLGLVFAADLVFWALDLVPDERSAVEQAVYTAPWILGKLLFSGSALWFGGGGRLFRMFRMFRKH